MNKILSVFLTLTTIFGEIIPANRKADWNLAGQSPLGPVPFTTYTQWCNPTIEIPGSANVAIPDDDLSDDAAMTDIISLQPTNSYVYWPAGTYNFSGQKTITRSYTMQKGAGASQTRFKGAYFTINPNSSLRKFYPMYDPSGVVAKGTSNIVIQTTGVSPSTSTSMLPTVGSVIQIGVTNDNVLIDPDGYEGNSYNTYSQMTSKNLGQSSIITAVSTVDGTNRQVTFWPPAQWNYTNSLGVIVRQANSTSKGIGFEDITFENSPKTRTYLMLFHDSAYCWVERCVFEWGYNQFLWLETVTGGVFRKNTFKWTQYTTPGGGYAIEMLYYPSFNDISDNIFEGPRVPIISSGGIANVISYNYTAWTTNYNNALAKWDGQHASAPTYILHEGNEILGRVGGDFTHGSAVFNTYFRNRIRGRGPIGHSTGASTTYNWCLNLDAKALYYTVVGNVFGESGMSGNYESSWLVGDGSRSASTRYIYSLGYQTDGSGSTNVYGGVDYDPNVRQTLLRQMNYNYINNGWITDNTNVEDSGDTNLVNSLYLSAQPTWWRTNMAWPPNWHDSNEGMIPAKYRYLNNISPDETLPSVSCTYELSSSSTTIGSAGGTGDIGITTQAACEWTSTSNAAWITITGGASGIDSGTTSYSASANTGSLERSGTITIADQVFTITQSAPTPSVTSGGKITGRGKITR